MDSPDTVISHEYKKLNADLHASGNPFGTGGWKHMEKAKDFTGTILDYGCGKQTFSKKMAEKGIKVTDYDPCIPGLDAKPEPHDFVYCTDVLEHVEPEFVDNVLRDLRRVTKKQAYVWVCTVPSIKRCLDGSDPHKTVQNHEWWLKKFEKYFTVKLDDVDLEWFGAYLE